MPTILDPPVMMVKHVRNCGFCHECGQALISAGEDGEEDWCRGCCQEKAYRSHGYGGMGDEPEFCPYVDIEFLNRGRELVRARGLPDGRRLLYEHHQAALPITD